MDEDPGRVTDEEILDEIGLMEKEGFIDGRYSLNQLSDEEMEQVCQQAFERKTKKRVAAIKLMQKGYSLEKQDRWNEAVIYYNRARFSDKKIYMYWFTVWHPNPREFMLEKRLEGQKELRKAEEQKLEREENLLLLRTKKQHVEKKIIELQRSRASGVIRDWMIEQISKSYTTDELQIGMDVLILPLEQMKKSSVRTRDSPPSVITTLDSTPRRLAKVEPDGIMINDELLQDSFLHKLLVYLEGEQEVEELYEGKIRRILDPTEPECIESASLGWFLGEPLVEISSTEEMYDGKIGYVRAVWLSNAYDTGTAGWDSHFEYYARLPY